MKNEAYVTTDLIDKMSKIKSDFKFLSADAIENILKDMTEEEKNILLKLYIYAERNEI